MLRETARGDQADATKGSPAHPSGLRPPMPLCMWGQAEASALLADIDADRQIKDVLTLPVMAMVPDLPSAVRAT
jgi:hypothetical protein